MHAGKEIKLRSLVIIYKVVKKSITSKKIAILIGNSFSKLWPFSDTTQVSAGKRFDDN